MCSKTKTENYKDSLFNNKTMMRSQLRFKGDHHNVYTEELNKIALNSSDDKRLQTYPYETNVLKYVEVKCLVKYVATYVFKKH